jgi:Uma2 family endonuclease
MPSSLMTLMMPPSLEMSDDQFFDFCTMNREVRIERDRFGVISVMPPVGSGSGKRELGILGQLWVWSEQNGTGVAFSSSAGFKLPNGADRSPDAAWVKLDRWNALTPEQQEKFAPICPDFVVELRSASDNLKPLREKMEEYQVQPGFQLGLLVDRKHQRVYIYRSGQVEVCVENVTEISCEPELPGFVLQLARIW